MAITRKEVKGGRIGESAYVYTGSLDGATGYCVVPPGFRFSMFYDGAGSAVVSYAVKETSLGSDLSADDWTATTENPLSTAGPITAVKIVATGAVNVNGIAAAW